jgi:hypothetical protein
LADGGLSIRKAAAFVDHSETWVKERIRSGEFASFTLAKKRVFPRRVLVAYLERKRRESEAADRRSGGGVEPPRAGRSGTIDRSPAFLKITVH